MTRFLPYQFQEQAGDELIFINAVGAERRVPFKIINVALSPLTNARFLAWPTVGAWVYNERGVMKTVPAPTADNEIDALSRFMHALRQCGDIYDQVDRALPLLAGPTA